MAIVIAKHAERFDQLLRRFNRAVDRDNILREVKERECYEKPSVYRKRAKAAARKRTQRQVEDSKPQMTQYR